MKKRIFVFLLCAALCCTLLPVTALAASGIDLSTTPTGTGYSWDSATSTLTLTNIHTSDNFILPDVDCTIYVSGNCSVGRIQYPDSSYQNKSITIFGGRLNANIETQGALTLENTTLNGSISNPAVGHSYVLTLRYSTVTLTSLSWMTDGGITLVDSYLGITGGQFWTEQLTMDEDSAVYSAVELSNYGHLSDGFESIFPYLPEGYTIGHALVDDHPLEPITILDTEGRPAAGFTLGNRNRIPGSSGILASELTFETNGGNTIKPRVVPTGRRVVLDQYVPIRPGCTFDGWALETGEAVESVIVKESMTVYARWTVHTSFPDVSPEDYYAAPAAWGLESGVIEGVNGLFAADQFCTRAQFITMLWRASGCPAATMTTHSFVDVPAGAYYTEALLWALENGITTGTSATTFSPDAQCTRAQVLTMLHRACGAPAADGASFTDVPVGAYYAEAAAWAYATGLATGTGSGLFQPDALCTRAQAVTFLYRAFAF